MAGGGVAALSLRAVRDDLDAGRLVRVVVDGLEVSRPLAAIWHPERTPVPAAQQFLAIASGATT